MDRYTDDRIRARINRAFDDVAARASAQAPGLGAPRRQRRSLAPLGAAVALAAATGLVGAVLLRHGPSPTSHGGVAHPATSASAAPAPSATPRPQPPDLFEPAVAADLQGGILLFGGGGDNASGGRSSTSQVWTWHGRWAQLNPATLPPSRTGAAMVADPARGDVVLFGGTDMSAPGQDVTLTDTWTWDGGTWTQRTTRHHPGMVGLFPLIADDPVTHQVVLVDNDAVTWTWDGSDWTAHRTSSGPNPWAPSVMAWDPVTRSVILADGEPIPGQVNGAAVYKTWSWRGSAWVRLHPAHEADIDHSLVLNAYAASDPAGITVLIPQGSKHGVAPPLLRHWNGSTWTTITPAAGPAFANGLVFTADGRLLCVDFDGAGDGEASVQEWTGGRWVDRD